MIRILYFYTILSYIFTYCTEVVHHSHPHTVYYHYSNVPRVCIDQSHISIGNLYKLHAPWNQNTVIQYQYLLLLLYQKITMVFAFILYCYEAMLMLAEKRNT